MQECFRKHPEIYGAELSDDADDDEEEEKGEFQTQASEPAATAPAKVTTGEKLAFTRPEDPTDEKKAAEETKRAKSATEQVARDFAPESESEGVVPKAAFSAVEQEVDHQNVQDPKKGGW